MLLRSKALLFRLIAGAAIVCFLLLSSTALMESINIPKGVKNYYSYDTEDQSIIPVKQKLVELAYLSADKANNAWLNNTLKEAVIKFQKDHGLKADGTLNNALFKVLFSASGSSSVEDSFVLNQSGRLSSVSANDVKNDKAQKRETQNSDSNQTITVIVLLISVSVIVILICIVSSRNRKNTEFVKEHSKRYIEVKKLDSQYKFYSGIPYQYSLQYSFQSKRSLDNADIHSYFILLANNDGKLREIYKEISVNRSAYAQYLYDYGRIGTINNDYIEQLNFDSAKFREVEEKICRPIKPPTRDITINIKLEYTSPKGQKSYNKTGIAHYDDLDNAYKENQRILIRRMQAEAERAKMSASLRYDIMRRDGFRCVICGAQQSDGVKLHVDHIYLYLAEEELNRVICARCVTGVIWGKVINIKQDRLTRLVQEDCKA